MMKVIKKIEDVKSITDCIRWYIKKPIEVRAIKVEEKCFVKTREGKIVANVGDYIIEGIEGEVYPCNAKIFKKTYEHYIKEKAPTFKMKKKCKHKLLGIGTYTALNGRTYEMCERCGEPVEIIKKSRGRK